MTNSMATASSTRPAPAASIEVLKDTGPQYSVRYRQLRLRKDPLNGGLFVSGGQGRTESRSEMPPLGRADA
jgi:hypothetical protein